MDEIGKNALQVSWMVQEQAASFGFDWPDIHGVLDKIEEELNEMREAVASGNLPHAQKELGDLLLAAVNTARFLEADPEDVLDKATKRFQARFRAVQKVFAQEGRDMKTCSLRELDDVWNRVKVDADQALENSA